MLGRGGSPRKVVEMKIPRFNVFKKCSEKDQVYLKHHHDNRFNLQRGKTR